MVQIRLLLLLLALSPIAMARQNSVQVVEGPGLPGNVAASSPSGSVNLEIRAMKLSVSAASETKNGDVVMIRDPRSGRGWWMWMNSSGTPLSEAVARFESEWHLYTDNSRIVACWFSTPNLWMGIGRQTYSNVQSMQAAIVGEVTAAAAAILDGSWSQTRSVNLRPVLGNGFLYKANTASAEPMPRIAGVRLHAGNWIVRLQGPNGDFAEATVPDVN